jgi:hypothetical protein
MEENKIDKQTQLKLVYSDDENKEDTTKNLKVAKKNPYSVNIFRKFICW